MFHISGPIFLLAWSFTLGLALVASYHINSRYAQGRSAIQFPRSAETSTRKQPRWPLWLFVIFLVGFVLILVWGEDFAYWDDEMFTRFAIRGINFGPPIYPDVGRFWPLGMQEFNVLKYISPSHFSFRAFAMAELVAWACVTAAALREFSLRFRIVTLLAIMLTPGFVISFSALVNPERNILFFLSCYVLCRRLFSSTGSVVWLMGALVSVQFALYYKEPVWVIFMGQSLTSLLLAWRSEEGSVPLRAFIGKNIADIMTAVMACAFLLFFFVGMFGKPLGYVDTHKLDLGTTVMSYLKLDPLVFVLLAVVAVRMAKGFRCCCEIGVFWHSLAVGGSLYALAYMGLRLFNAYYMAPVDAIAVIYLMQSARLWLRGASPIRARALIAIGAFIAVLNLLFSANYFILQKGTIAGNVQFASFLGDFIKTKATPPIIIFFPHADGYRLMELSAFLEYKGISLSDIRMQSPLQFPQGLCVGYRPDRCEHKDDPRGADLIVKLPQDDPVEDLNAGHTNRVEFEYKPPLVTAATMPFFEYFNLVSGHRGPLSKEWLQLIVYANPVSRYPLEVGSSVR
jgi:hypothetical protein